MTHRRQIIAVRMSTGDYQAAGNHRAETVLIHTLSK